MVHVFAFVELYVAPFLIALGFVQLFKGIINYFIIGPGFEEDRKEIGRHALLWAFVFFLAGLLIFGITHWFVGLSERWHNRDRVDVEIGEKKDLLKIPNVPQSEQPR